MIGINRSNYQGEDFEKIIGTGTEKIDVNDQEYMIVKESSELTGWTMYILSPVNQLTAGMSTVQSGILVAGFIGLIIFFIFSLFLSTFITKPITRLTKTMRTRRSISPQPCCEFYKRN